MLYHHKSQQNKNRKELPQHYKGHLFFLKNSANMRLIGEDLKVFPQRSRTRQGCLLPPLLFNTVL